MASVLKLLPVDATEFGEYAQALAHAQVTEDVWVQWAASLGDATLIDGQFIAALSDADFAQAATELAATPVAKMRINVFVNTLRKAHGFTVSDLFVPKPPEPTLPLSMRR